MEPMEMNLQVKLCHWLWLKSLQLFLKFQNSYF